MKIISTLLSRLRWYGNKIQEHLINKIMILYMRKYNPVSRDCLTYKIYIYIYRLFHKGQAKSSYKRLIAVSGFHYSGSSAVVGFLSEFSTTTVLGHVDAIYSRSIRNSFLSEVIFFKCSNLFNLIKAFKQGSELEKDLAIKKFISEIYTCYENKKIIYDYNPVFYSYDFLINSVEFLLKIIDTDAITRSILKKYRLPYTFNSQDRRFQACSFMKSEGINQYLLYKFAPISEQEFDTCVKEYIHALVCPVPSNSVLVCDQLLPGQKDALTLFRQYENTALQICVYRDPRDHFLAAFRWSLDYLPRDIDSFVAFYKKKTFEELFTTPSPYRLMVRFEDLVLRYDETARRIMDFCGLDPAEHVAPRAVFDPAVSAVNIGAYKQFHDQEFMRQIEERLGEYCYYPEKEHLSEAAWKLLREAHS